MRRTFWVLAAVVLAAFLLITSTAEAAKSITVPDIGANVGQHTSMVLDGSDKPVISYYDATNGNLKVKHCYDTTCLSGMYLAAPDQGGDVGQYTSLVLDSSGYPVISYYDVTGGNLKVLHCSDANCWGGSPNTPDTGGDVGRYTSLALDGSGKPVVSYYDATNGNLKVLHCDDVNCAGDESGNITSPDTGGDVGQYTSLALSGGKPLVSYYDVTNGNLKVLHCNDANCTGGDESITSPDTGGNVGPYTSLAVSGGNPVVSYYDVTNGDLKVLHCNDANCTGGDESIASPDTAGAVGAYTSLELDGSGNPVVSYYDLDNGNLKVLHCGNTDCNSGNSIASPDTTGRVGQYTSVAVSAGNPAVSYYDYTNGILKVLRCGNASCTSGNTVFIADYASGFASMSLSLDSAGYPVLSYYDIENDYLKLMHCNDPNCAGGDESIVFLELVGMIQSSTSLALDSSGKPVISYHNQDSGDLKVLHCGNANCTSGNIISTADAAGYVGDHSSMKLDTSGKPVVSYHDGTNNQLKLVHCGDANCAAGNIINYPDTAVGVGVNTSLALDASGNPVISYHDVTQGDLKVTHCDDPNCTSLGNSVTSPDTGGTDDVGEDTSLALDASGKPVISYYDNTNQNLKVLHCNDPNCDPFVGGAENPITVDQTGNVGRQPSLALDVNGYPVISYYDITNRDLKVLHCDDVNCAGDESGNMTVVDAGGDGRDNSLALDGGGYPVIAYEALADLRLLHCDTPNCKTPPLPPAGTDHFDVDFDAADISFHEVSQGAFHADGTATIERGPPYWSGGRECADFTIKSMTLTGTLGGNQVVIRAGEGLPYGVPVSTGVICEDSPGADIDLDLYIVVEVKDDPPFFLINPHNRIMSTCPCGPGASVPPEEACLDLCTTSPSGEPCANTDTEIPLADPADPYTVVAEVTPSEEEGEGMCSFLFAPVGGIAEWPGATAGPDSLADSSAGSGFNYTALGAALGAAAVALAAGAWLARRRWVR